jgi:steroid delta-isomerase-like uncharacterized protein
MRENEVLIRRWFSEVWNEKREASIDEMLDENSVRHGLGGTESAEIRGSEQFKGFYRAFVSAFPDLQVTVEDVACDGDKLAARCTVRGTHTGDGLRVPATGRTVEFTGLGLCTLKDGRFVEVWNEFDFLKMYDQLGLVSLKLG